MISLKQFRYLEAVVRHQHVGAAAEECAVSQPALSMQIKALEKHLGVQLLERHPKGVKPTDIGLKVTEQAQSVLTSVSDIEAYARHHRGVLTGRLRLGVIPSIAPYVLPSLLPLVRERYPGIELHIRESQTHRLTEELNQGSLDVLLAALPVDARGTEQIKLCEDRFLIATPAGFEIKGKLLASAADLKDQNLLLLEEGHCLRDQALSFCQLQQVSGINTQGASSLSTVVQMVANGMGVTFLPEISIETETQNRSVRLFRFGDPQPSRTIGLIWRASSPQKRDYVELGKLFMESIKNPL